MISGYDIRFAALDEQPLLRQFIDAHWRKGHALARSGELLDWQYRNEAEQRYNFVVGARAGSDEIDGILGYIPLSQFDPELRDRRDIWLAVWKVREDVSAAGLGLAMLMNLKNAVDPQSIGVVGLTDDAKRVYRALRYECGTLGHYYLANPKCEAFQILGDFDGRCFDNDASIDQSRRIRPLQQSEAKTVLEQMIADLQCGHRPVKSAEYFMRRYARHPYYRYRMWAIGGDGGHEAVLVTRAAEAVNRTALRIVDFCGPPQAWAGLRDELCRLLDQEQAEYVDIYAHGPVTSSLAAGGFLRRDLTSSVIVPNYFEPFEQKNVELEFAFWTAENSPYHILKGDTDQDRPNLCS